MSDKIKVIFVDDEYLERNLLKNCIEWNKLDIEVAGEASNADEALKLIDSVRPDIVFTDINMPIMDGLKLSNIIQSRYPDIKIVVVTGFDDFEHAHKSIKMGVSDFIVKPISDDEVYKTVLTLKQQIEKKRSDNEEYSVLRQQFLENLPFIREKFYNELISGEIDDKKAIERMLFLGISFRGNSYQAAVIEYADGESSDEESHFLQSMQVLNRVKEFFKSMVVFTDTRGRAVVINYDENIDLYEKCEEFLSGAPADICIGVGNIKKDLSSISLTYKEALEALKYKVAVGMNSVILHSSIRPVEEKSDNNAENLNEKLVFGIKSRLLESAVEAADQIFDRIDIKSEKVLKEIRITAGNIASLCLKVLMESGEDVDYIYKESLRVNSDFMALTTMPHAREYVKEFIKKSVEKTGRINQHKISDIVLDVKNFIDGNYSDCKLSLTLVAGKLFLNPSYLSRTFKKESGESFVEYLTSVRMEKAMRLLKKNEYKAFEVAEMVGISDANYFCSCFKKYFGVSVSSFKKAEKND